MLLVIKRVVLKFSSVCMWSACVSNLRLMLRAFDCSVRVYASVEEFVDESVYVC